MKQVKTKEGQSLYIHYVPYTMQYVIVGESEEKIKLFKISITEIDEDEQTLKAYLLEEVQKRYPDVDKDVT